MKKQGKGGWGTLVDKKYIYIYISKNIECNILVVGYIYIKE